MNVASQAGSLNHLAVQLQAQGRSQESLSAFQRAAELYREAGDHMGEGRCLNGVGALYKDMGDPQNAAVYLEQALTLRRQTRDLLGEAITLTTLGPVYPRLGRPRDAHECLTRALQITRELGQRRREGEVLYNLAEVASMAGQPGRAYPLLVSALAIAREQGNPLEVSKCLNSLACTCNDLGKTQEALSYCSECLRFFKMVGNARGYSAALNNMGLFLLGTNLAKQSRAYFEEAIAIDLQTNALGLAALTMTLLAETYLKDDLKLARDIARRSLAVAKEVGDNNLVCEALGSQCRVLMEDGDLQSAFEILNKAMGLAKQTGNRHMEGGVSHMMALALFQAGRCDAAFAKFEDAISIFEEHYLDLQTEDFRLSYFNALGIQNIYYLYISRLVEHSQKSADISYTAKAFHISERRRARSLREYLQAKPLSRIEDSTQPQDHDGAGQAMPQATRTGIWLSKAPEVVEVQQGLLDDHSVLLEFSLHNQVSYLLILTRNSYSVVTLKSGGSEIRERVDQLRQALISGSESYLKLAHELYGILIRPAEYWLDGKRHLLIIPDGALHLLPFQVLVSDLSESVDSHAPEPEGESASRSFGFRRMFGRVAPRRSVPPYLIRNYSITYAPSAGILGALGADRQPRPTARKELIAFAPVEFASGEHGAEQPSSLPGTLREVDGIAGLFESNRVVVRKFAEATKHCVVSEQLKDYRFVHFATHGFINDDDPDGSSIVLHGENEASQLLRIDEIARLELSADLVVLSACETALGTVKAGEGVLGLVRAFFCAGARSVCASMWKVDDMATAALMNSFYKKIVTEGLSKTEALRASQLEMVGTDRWALPRFWAAFVLVGASD